MWKSFSKFVPQTIPVVNVHGIINRKLTEKVFRRIDSIRPSTAVALAVSVNSRGGLPVQSELIAKRIMSFAEENKIKVYMFAGEYAASGGYMILSAGHQAYADRTSLVGSIGVVFTKMHLKGLLDLSDISLHSLSSNEKSLQTMTNPYTETTAEAREQLEKSSKILHDKFIEMVKQNRGSKLKNDGEIFSAQIYSGEQALDLGLVDGLGSMARVMRDKYPDAQLTFEDNRPLWIKAIG